MHVIAWEYEQVHRLGPAEQIEQWDRLTLHEVPRLVTVLVVSPSIVDSQLLDNGGEPAFARHDQGGPDVATVDVSRPTVPNRCATGPNVTVERPADRSGRIDPSGRGRAQPR
jgi:hypothetical protein